MSVFYAYKHKPVNIKYGNISIQTAKVAYESSSNIASNITSNKPGIKAIVSTNSNNDKMFYNMLNGNIDIIIPSREMNESEKELALENNISYKKLPFAHLKDKNNTIIYMYINDSNYNNKPENKVFAKNYFGSGKNLLVLNDLDPLSDEEYKKNYDYLKLIDEF